MMGTGMQGCGPGPPPLQVYAGGEPCGIRRALRRRDGVFWIPGTRCERVFWPVWVQESAVRVGVGGAPTCIHNNSPAKSIPPAIALLSSSRTDRGRSKISQTDEQRAADRSSRVTGHGCAVDDEWSSLFQRAAACPLFLFGGVRAAS